MTLLEEARARLEALPRGTTLTELSRETGLGIGWLHRFARGKTQNPGVIEVEKLLTYLRSR